MHTSTSNNKAKSAVDNISRTLSKSLESRRSSGASIDKRKGLFVGTAGPNRRPESVIEDTEASQEGPSSTTATVAPTPIVEHGDPLATADVKGKGREVADSATEAMANLAITGGSGIGSEANGGSNGAAATARDDGSPEHEVRASIDSSSAVLDTLLGP
jgi:hypothetical protein